MTQRDVDIADALHGLDAARRVGWAKAYAAEGKIEELEDRLDIVGGFLRLVLWNLAWSSVLEEVKDDGAPYGWATRWRDLGVDHAAHFWWSLPTDLHKPWVMAVLEEDEREWEWKPQFLDLMRTGLKVANP